MCIILLLPIHGIHYTNRELASLVNILQQSDLIVTKAVFNLKSEVHRNYLSFAWWVIEPFLHMAVFYLFFTRLLDVGNENFGSFLICGLIPWLWFSKATANSATSIMVSQGLILQSGVNPVIPPIITLVQSTLKEIPALCLLFIFLWVQGFGPNTFWVFLPILFIIQFVFMFAICNICAYASTVVQDLTVLIPTGLTFAMFLSGIFFDYTNFSPQIELWFTINPLAFLINCYRQILLEATMPNFELLGILGTISLISALLTLFLYKSSKHFLIRSFLE